MVSILLTVLKIIGIAILAILGLILFILLLILFVPVRYRAEGAYRGSKFTADMRATWLLHAVSLAAGYSMGQAFHMRLRLFGIAVYDNLKPEKVKFKNKKIKSTKTKPEKAGEIQAASWSSEETQETEQEQTEPVILENDYEKKYNIDDAGGYDTGQLSTDDTDENEQFSEKETGIRHIFQKIKSFFINFVNFFKNIKFTFQKICDTIVKIKDNIKYYLELLQLDSTKQAFATCKKQVFWVLKKMLPKNFRINLHLGFENPATMGEVLAVWGMFYPVHQGNIDIQPEFDASVMEGDFSLKGSIRVYTFVKAACILFFNKDIKHLIHTLKNETK